MLRHRAFVVFALGLTAASVSTPAALRAAASERFPQLPSNPYCLRAACGYGRDGIDAPYPGGGLRGEAARTMAAADSIFQSSNASLRSWVTSREMSGAPANANDIWGYVAPSGREYAIVGLLTGTAFVEVTDTSSPVVVGFIPGAASSWRDMAVYGEYAYSVNETHGGVQIIDLRRIDRGKVKLLGSFDGGGLRTAHNIAVNPDSGYAYLLGANIARGGLVALDLSNPAAPQLEPVAWETAYVHDVIVVTYDRCPYRGREIAFAFTGSLGLHIVDVTDKAAPETLSHLRYEGATYSHSGALSSNGRVLYLNDELDERASGGEKALTTYVIRVANPAKPRLIRQINPGTEAIDHNSMVQNGRLFISSYTGGLRILDLRNRTSPRAYGHFDTYPESDEAKFQGAWGVFADFPSGTVIVSDIARGLFVIEPQ
ncbi:MAG: choice-of-anchor B family protein [Acidobacteria bacterium]|nr:choice-of-anchor B family protein [Acidobacteriota bacterium]